ALDLIKALAGLFWLATLASFDLIDRDDPLAGGSLLEHQVVDLRNHPPDLTLALAPAEALGRGPSGRALGRDELFARAISGDLLDHERGGPRDALVWSETRRDLLARDHLGELPRHLIRRLVGGQVGQLFDLLGFPGPFDQ